MKSIRLVVFGLWLLSFSACQSQKDQAEKYFFEGKYEEAISLFSKVLFVIPDDINALYYRARAHEELGELKEALEDYNRIISLDARHGKAYMGRGNTYWKLESWEKAERDFLNAIRFDQTGFDGYYMLGRAALKRDDFKTAKEMLTLAMEINPEHDLVYYYRGLSRAKFGDPNAIGDFNVFIQKRPNVISAYYNRAVCFMNKNWFNWALTDLNHVIKQDPNHADAIIRRGIAYAKLSERELGCADLNRAMQLNHPEAANYLATYCQ